MHLRCMRYTCASKKTTGSFCVATGAPTLMLVAPHLRSAPCWLAYFYLLSCLSCSLLSYRYFSESIIYSLESYYMPHFALMSSPSACCLYISEFEKLHHQMKALMPSIVGALKFPSKVGLFFSFSSCGIACSSELFLRVFKFPKSSLLFLVSLENVCFQQGC